MTEVEFAGASKAGRQNVEQPTGSKQKYPRFELEAWGLHMVKTQARSKGVSAHAFWLSLYFGGDRATKTNIRTLTHEYEST